MDFNILNSLILAGVIQGFTFGIIYLFSRKNRDRSTFYLAALILAFSYNNLQFFLSNSGIISGKTMYETFYIPVGSLVPVFIYFYVLVFLNPEKPLFKKYHLFYLPFALFVLFIAIPYKIGGLTGTNEIYYPIYRKANAFQSSFSLIYTLILIFLSYITVLRAEKLRELKNSSYRWLKLTLLILFLLACFWSFALFKFLSNPELEFYFNFLWLGLSICIYWLGHFGIYKYGIERERKKIRDKRQGIVFAIASEKTQNEHLVKLKKIVVEEKRYLDSKLTLDVLAKELQLSKSHLSRMINTELKTSFSDYLNSLRVEEAKKFLLTSEFSRYTLVAIGLEAGFNSKTTFYTTFKKFTGKSPAQYRRENK